MATQFLESLGNPVFKEETKTPGNYRITTSIFVEGSQPKEKLEELAKSPLSKMGAVFSLIKISCDLLKIEKTAIVVTVERQSETIVM